MNQEWGFLLGLIGLCAVMYIVLRRNAKEGFSDASNGSATSSVTGGLGERSTQYNASLKSKTIQWKDKLLIDKYKSEYEEILLHADEHFDQLMLNEVLTMQSDPLATADRLSKLHLAKQSLNHVMKYLDA